MVGLVARKEAAEHLASFRFRVGALLTLALSLLALWTTGESYQVRRQIWAEEVAAESRALQRVATYSYLRPHVLRPPEPLSILDQGFDARLGSAVRIDLFSIPRSARGEYLGNEFMAAGPAVDLTAIVGIVLAFLALLLTCDSVNREREKRTLPSLLAAGVTPRALLAGKFLGALGVLAALLAALLLLAAAFCGLYAGGDLEPRHAIRLAGLLAAYLGYLSLMVLLGLLVSLGSRGSSQALVSAIVLWLLVVLILPDVASSLANDHSGAGEARWAAEQQEARLADTWRREVMPSRSDPLLGRISGHSPMYVQTEDDSRAVLFRYGSARYYTALAHHFDRVTAAGRRYARQVDAAHRPADRALRSGQDLALAWAALSPRVLLEGLSHSLAGTSTADHDRFLAQCRRYRRRILGYFETQRAVDSWRWFTDDRPGRLYPWPRFFGLSPEQVSEQDVARLFSRLGEPAIEAALRENLQRIELDPERRLDLAALPRFTPAAGGLREALRQAALEVWGLAGLNLLAVAAVWRLAGRAAGGRL